MNRIENIWNLHTKIQRFRDGRRGLKRKLANAPQMMPLTQEECRQIDNYWGGVKIDKRWFMFNKAYYNHSFDVRYIPEDIFYGFVDTYYSRAMRAKYAEDKNFLYFYFPDVKQPRTLARFINGMWLDEQYQIITIDAVKRVCANKDIVVKESRGASGGHGVSIIHVSEKGDNIEEVVNAKKEYVIQELIKQHAELAALHKESLNTVRLMSFIDSSGQTKILSTIVRMGVGKMNVDNASIGGIFCGVNDDGSLKDIGYDWDGRTFTIHPNGTHFEDHHIPGYAELKTLVCKLAPRLLGISKIISWDFAIAEDCSPILIEANMSYGGIDFHQMANGPIFGDDTKRIIQEVFMSKENKIINKYLLK